MSDFSQGPGWWQASDGKWYPPEQAPGATPATPPPAGPPPGYGAPPAGGPPPGYGAPAGAPGGTGVGDALGYGWKKFQEFLGPILVAAAVYVGGILVFGFLGNILAAGFDGVVGQLILSFIQLVVSSAVAIVVIRATLLIVDGKPLDTAAIFSGDQLVPYIIGSLIYSVIAVIGLALCVIPGLIFMFLAWFWGYFLIDKSMEPVDAIKASVAFVRANVGTLLGWAIVSTLVVIVGFILCFVGALAAIPVAYIGTAYLYRRLNNEPVAV